MCIGRSPFRADSAVAVLRRVCDDQPRPIQEINPEMPGWLCAVIEKLMAKRPEERYQSAAEVAELLNHYLAWVQQQPRAAAWPPRRPSPVHHSGRRTILLYAAIAGIAAVGLCLVLAVMAAVVSYTHLRRGSESMDTATAESHAPSTLPVVPDSAGVPSGPPIATAPFDAMAARAQQETSGAASRSARRVHG